MQVSIEAREKAMNDANALTEKLGQILQAKQQQIDTLMMEKTTIGQQLHQLELRYATQANHASYLNKNNQTLMERNKTVVEELRLAQ